MKSIINSKSIENSLELEILQFSLTKEYDAICLSDAGSFFNDSSKPNAEVNERDFKNLVQTFVTKMAVAKGNEITIYCNEAFDNFVNV